MWCLELVIHRVAPGLSMILTNKVLAFLCVCLSFFTLDPHPPFPSENGFEEKTSLHTQNQIFLKTLMWIKKSLDFFSSPAGFEWEKWHLPKQQDKHSSLRRGTSAQHQMEGGVSCLGQQHCKFCVLEVDMNKSYRTESLTRQVQFIQERGLYTVLSGMGSFLHLPSKV